MDRFTTRIGLDASNVDGLCGNVLQNKAAFEILDGSLRRRSQTKLAVPADCVRPKMAVPKGVK